MASVNFTYSELFNQGGSFVINYENQKRNRDTEIREIFQEFRLIRRNGMTIDELEEYATFLNNLLGRPESDNPIRNKEALVFEALALRNELAGKSNVKIKNINTFLFYETQNSKSM